jgi:putative ABC transport system permease protein
MPGPTVSLFRNLLRRNAVEQALDDELRSSVELLTEEKISEGLSLSQARRRALIELGGVEQVKTKVREIRLGRLFENVAADFRFAWRTMAKSPGFTLTAIVTAALGIGANAACFGVINTTLLQPLPYPHENLLVNLSERSTKTDGPMPASYLDFLDWKRQQTSFSALTICRTYTAVNLKANGSAERLLTVMVDADFLKVLGFQPMLGRDLRPEDDLPGSQVAILLPYSTWARQFNSDAQVVGRVVDVDGRSATIVGVLPPAFRFSTPADLVLPLGPFVAQLYMEDRHNHSNAKALGRLKPGVTLAAATSEMNAIASRLSEQYPKSNSSIGVALMGLHQYLLGDAKQRQLLLMAAVGLVLLIVCINIATFSLARSFARNREMAIRAALGADRPRLVRQIIVESLLLAAIGGGLGLLLATELTNALKSLVPFALLRFSGGNVSVMDWRVVIFTLTVTVLTGVGFGLVPAWQLSRTRPNEVLKDHRTLAAPFHGRVQTLDLLVIVQVGSAALLLVTAGLILRSFWLLSTKPLGYEAEHLLSLRLASPGARFGGAPLRIAEFYQDAADRLAQLPGVESAAVVSNAAFGFNDSHSQFRLADRPVPPPGDFPTSEYRIVSPDYFRTMGIPVLEGRVFNGKEPTPVFPPGAPTKNDAIEALRKIPMDMVVTQSFARRFWPGQDPIGKGVLIGSPDLLIVKCTVIGVVGDTTQDNLGQTDHEEYYVSLRQFPMFPDYYLLMRTSQNPATLIESAKTRLRQMSATEPVFDVQPLASRVADSISGQTFQSKLIGSFAALALVLASFGLYGVLAFSVGRRAREIGIRMALGAQRISVVGNVFFRGFAMVIPGLIIGSVGAWLLGRALQSQLFEVSANELLIYPAALLPLLLAAVPACWLPARRAASVDPMQVLRNE